MAIRFAKILLLLSVLGHGEVAFGAERPGFCRGWFSFLGAPKPKMMPDEIAAFRAAFGPKGSHPFSGEANASPEIFSAALENLPELIRQRLFAPPGATFGSLEKLGADLSKRSFLDQVLKRIDREGLGTIETDLARFKAAPLTTRAAAAGAWARSVKLARARETFDASAGEVALQLETRPGASVLKIAGEEIPARREGNSVYLEVPREKVAHPFWNPVAPEKVMQMARAKVKAPARYQTMLGHDGKFYLVDGNHRFDLDPRKTIPVELPSLTTVNLRAMLDLVGIEQPTNPELILDYVEGRAPWQALVPAEKRKLFVIPPAPPRDAPAAALANP